MTSVMRLRLLTIALLLPVVRLLADGGSSNFFISTTDTADYTGLCMANGGIGILPGKEPFEVEQVILNHVFDRGGRDNVSHVLAGLNPFCMTMYADGSEVEAAVEAWSQTIDMKRAVFTTSFTVPGKAEVSYEVAALRNLAFAGIVNVEVKALSDTRLRFDASTAVPSDYASHVTDMRTVWGEGGRKDVARTTAHSAGGTHTVAAASGFVCDTVWKYGCDKETGHAWLDIDLKKGQKAAFSLTGAVCSTRDFADPVNEAERLVIYMKHEGREALMQRHEALWNELWQGDIIIEGDDYAQRQVRFALFNLYSSCREGSRLSVPPMGLSSKGYNGHIFWDAEMWMLPPMLLLGQPLAKAMLDYRADRLDAARCKAAAYGYRGAMFPWESDDWGEEATPTFALTGPFEHHVTADIAIAAYRYFCATADTAWLETEGYPMMKDIADFWVSRAADNGDGTFSIRNVTGADEYANGVTDNAFTNGAASLALRYACKAAAVCGEKPRGEWGRVAEGLRILTFPDGTLCEYEGYDGRMIKQCDANLLGYPLGLRTEPELLRKDMEYYGSRIDTVNGPAMSYSIFAVQYARMGDADNAWRMFLKSFQPHERPPFGSLAETPTSHNPYFMTGAGGLLQAVLYGFAGLEVTADGIVQVQSVLPRHWKRLTVTGVGPDRKTFVVEGAR